MKGKKLTPEEFIVNSNIVHNHKYDYSKTEYTLSKNKVLIICPLHGEFYQNAQSHLQGRGCLKCANIIHRTCQVSTKDAFVEKVSKVHNNKYDYSLVNYINNNTHVNIICPEHGSFFQTPRGHLKYGCPSCHLRGYSKENWVKIAEKNNHSSLYIIRCFDENENFIKIGITSKSLKDRFNPSELPYKYEPIIQYFNPPDKTWDFEKKLHKECKYHKYIPKQKFNGMYECFNYDVLDEICYLFCD